MYQASAINLILKYAFTEVGAEKRLFNIWYLPLGKYYIIYLSLFHRLKIRAMLGLGKKQIYNFECVKTKLQYMTLNHWTTVERHRYNSCAIPQRKNGEKNINYHYIHCKNRSNDWSAVVLEGQRVNFIWFLYMMEIASRLTVGHRKFYYCY